VDVVVGDTIELGCFILNAGVGWGDFVDHCCGY
jgi:hypothetical protein